MARNRIEKPRTKPATRGGTHRSALGSLSKFASACKKAAKPPAGLASGAPVPSIDAPPAPLAAVFTSPSLGVPLDDQPEVPEDGAKYPKPTRKYFAKMHWRADLNAFVRNDVTQTTTPRGPVPQGYVWAGDINGWRRTRGQTRDDMEAQGSTINARLDATGAPLPYGPGTNSGVTTKWSFYVSAMGDHVPIGWYENLKSFFEGAFGPRETATAKIGMSLERGDRKKMLHIQGIAEFESTVTSKEAIVAGMKTAMGIQRGMKCKVDFNAFTGQDWKYCLGYIQKDEGKPHFRLWALGITGTEMRDGKREYAHAVRAPEQGRALITRTLFLRQMYQVLHRRVLGLRAQW